MIAIFQAKPFSQKSILFQPQTDAASIYLPIDNPSELPLQ